MKRMEKRRWLIALALNIIVFGIYFAIGQFQNIVCEDDFVISRIADGSFGARYSAYLIYPNYVMGLIVKFFYYLYRGINWWIVLQITFCILSFTVITEAFEEKLGMVSGIALSICMLLLFGDKHFVDFNYTQNAALCLAAGLFGWFVSIYNIGDKGEKSKRISVLTALSLMLIWIGFLLRGTIFLCALPFGLIIVTDLLLKKEKHTHILLHLGILIILMLTSAGINKIAYSSDGWKEYWQYNEVRTMLLDYEIPWFENYKAEYRNLQLSENDFELLSSWVYADEEVFSEEKLGKLAALVEDSHSIRLDKEIIKYTLENFLDAIEKYPYGYVLMVLSVVAFLVLPWKQWWMIFGIWGCVGAEYWYLTCKDRWVFRAEYAPWCIAIILMVYLCVYEKRRHERQFGKSTAYLIFACSIVFLTFCKWQDFSSYLNIGRTTTKSEDFQNVLTYISENKENIYVCSSVGGQSSQYTLFDVMPEDCMKNLYYLGGWTVPSPIMQDKADKYLDGKGIAALTRYDNVYLIDTRKVEMIDIFLREHYNFQGTYEVVDTIGGYKIYKFHG